MMKFGYKKNCWPPFENLLLSFRLITCRVRVVAVAVARFVAITGSCGHSDVIAAATVCQSGRVVSVAVSAAVHFVAICYRANSCGHSDVIAAI